MSKPTPIERVHYATLVGRRILKVLWQDMEGQALPVLLLEGKDREGKAATVAVLADPEGNGLRFLEHQL